MSNGDPPPIDERELRCPACDYDLRALSGERCPECGLLIDRQSLSVSQIPWTHRRTMGRFRAFRRSVWLTVLRPRQIAADVSMPVSLADARRFQFIVLSIVFVPLVGIGLWGFSSLEDGLFSSLVNGPLRPRWRVAFIRSLGGALECIGLVFAAACLWLFLKSITGVASYFFHPRDLSISRQNRAIALSYYACAPLALTPISMAIAVALFFFASSKWADGPGGYRIVFLLISALFLCVAVQFTAWLRCSLVLLKRTTRCSGMRVTILGISLPFTWFFCGVLTLGVLPLAYLFICVVILSLR